jgi:hypothetical protein
MLLSGRELYAKIKEVIERPQYQPGKKRSDGTMITFCNEAANTIFIEMGYDTKSILNPQGIGWTGATALYDNAVKAITDEKSGVTEIDGRQAQAYANLGIPILAAARRKIDDAFHSSHVGIVAGDDNTYDPVKGPWVGQAGAVNGFRSAYDSFTKWGLSTPRYFMLPKK